MKIIATQDYLRGRTRLEAGKGYELSDAEAWQLIGLSAAREAGAEDKAEYECIDAEQLCCDAPMPSKEEVTLEVQDVLIGVESPKVAV